MAKVVLKPLCRRVFGKGTEVLGTHSSLGTRLGSLKHISCHPPKQAQQWVLFAPP